MSLANLFQWSAQLALVAGASALVMRFVRVEAPVLRHAFWRWLLAFALALPLLQPWTPQVLDSGAVAPEAVDTVAPPAPDVRGVGSGLSTSDAARRFLSANAAASIAFVLAAGMVARLMWLAAGILRLRRLCRAGRPASPGGEYDDIAARIRVSAEIRYADRVGQPVTFGLMNPVVLLPERVASLDSSIRRAILAHELWHIRRRDWAWVLVEESIRAVLWFNPAVSWLVSKVQATREEVVDELTVQITNARKAYLEALLMFADEPTIYPAAPLARRRHLFHRMLLISREAVMSSRRVVSSFAAAAMAIAAVAWHGASMFPLHAEPTIAAVPAVAAPASAPGPTITVAAPALQAPARDRRPNEPAPETVRERELKREIATDRGNRDLYFKLAALQTERRAYRDLDETFAAMRSNFPNDSGVLSSIARTYAQIGRFEAAVSTLEEIAALDPTNPRSHHLIATFYWEKAFKDAALTPARKLEYVRAGIAAEDKALTYDPDFSDALVYKNILLRLEANLDPANSASLIAEADALRARALELNRARSGGPQGGVPGGAPGGVAGGVRRSEMEFVPAPGQAPPPPPPPPPPGVELTHSGQDLIDGLAPLRVGGTIRPPKKIRDAPPVYPPIAQSAGVQGVVIIEATIDTAGRIARARLLRGQPLLDQAALDAVAQWQFEPVLVNGVPTPVIMTVTVNFTMQ